MKMLSRLAILSVCLLTIAAAHAQQANIPAPVLFGTGAPPATSCNSAFLGYQYVDVTPGVVNGRIYICDMSSGTGSPLWDHPPAPVQNVVQSSVITGGVAIAGTCFPSTPLQVSVPGAIVGSSGALGSFVFASPYTGNIGQFNLSTNVSAANTVSVQACSTAIIGTIPNFSVKILLD